AARRRLRQALRPVRGAARRGTGVRDGPSRGDKPAGQAAPFSPRAGGEVRARGRWHGAGQRVQRAQRSAGPAPPLRAAGAASPGGRRGGPAARRGLHRCVGVRHAAHRRSRRWHRQVGDAARRRTQHPRRRAVPAAETALSAPRAARPTFSGTPDWVKDAVFYQVFPDRFAASDRLVTPANLERWGSPPTVYGYKGGDLFGVAERLGHIQALGATAIYLNP